MSHVAARRGLPLPAVDPGIQVALDTSIKRTTEATAGQCLASLPL